MDIDFQRFSDKASPALRARRLRLDMVKRYIVAKLNKEGEVQKKKIVALICATFGLDKRKVQEYLDIFVDSEIFLEEDGNIVFPHTHNVKSKKSKSK